MSRLKLEPMEHPDRILQYWKREKNVVILIILFGLGFNISSVLGPILQGRLLDVLLQGNGLAIVLNRALMFVLIILGIQVMRYIKRFYIRRFANRTSARMRFMIYNHIMHKELVELDQEDTGDLMTKTMGDVDLCVEGMRKFTTEIFDTGVLMGSYLVSMLIYDVRITLLAGLFIPMAMLLAEKLKGLIYRYTRAYRSKSSEISSTIYDAIDQALLYRVYGLDDQNSRKFDRDLDDLREKAIRATLLENAMQPVYQVIAMIGIVPVIYLGGTKVIAGDWTVGAFSSYLIMFTALAVKASKAAKLFNSVQKSQISWKRIKPFLTEYQVASENKAMTEHQAKSEHQTQSDHQAKTEHQTMPGSLPETVQNDANPLQHTRLEVDDLTFIYPDRQEPVVKNICFEADQGEMIGITGPISSGKSSLGLALAGIYPYLGRIRINGKELKDYSRSECSQMIAYLGHSLQLLSDTLYNNITLGDEQDIASVLSDVAFDEDLADMPEGRNTLVGSSGVRLSGGQQSRVALARTLLRKHRIIILDDPFAAVDLQTEEQIMNKVRQHHQAAIIILISHRLAVFRQVDRIILLHADRSSEVGTHAELMQNSSLYAAIMDLQSRTGGDPDAR